MFETIPEDLKFPRTELLLQHLDQRIGNGHPREALLATVCALEAGFETSKNPNKNKKLVPSSQEKGNQPILFTF